MALPPTLRRRALAALAAALLLIPGAAVGAECEGDECQAPPAAPEDPYPATATAQGPPNPPVRFPQRAKKKKDKGKQRGGGQSGRGGR